MVPYPPSQLGHKLEIWTPDALKQICPNRALLIGMTHDFDQHKDNEVLMEWSESINPKPCCRLIAA
ncbi:hypothetical protein J1N35_007457 [Gossypium stocksii]|uniref:Uncharacterized protein n=1 Tax=Gossypium stocksii TaxID=47602 RepID=A0A9D3W6I3_9ROSI|nr:hypothetical protein J1N35_007457 [Gossypium stocksii]